MLVPPVPWTIGQIRTRNTNSPRELSKILMKSVTFLFDGLRVKHQVCFILIVISHDYWQYIAEDRPEMF